MRETLARKRKVLINDKGRTLCVVLDPGMVSIDGKFIRLGQFFSDEVTGYYPVDDVLGSVVSVLKEF